MSRGCHFTLFTSPALGLLRAPSFRMPGEHMCGGTAWRCPHPVATTLDCDTPACAVHAQMATDMRAQHGAPVNDS